MNYIRQCWKAVVAALGPALWAGLTLGLVQASELANWPVNEIAASIIAFILSTLLVSGGTWLVTNAPPEVEEFVDGVVPDMLEGSA